MSQLFSGQDILCCFIMACSNEKATKAANEKAVQAANESEAIEDDSTITNVILYEPAQDPEKEERDPYGRTSCYHETKLDFGTIETFLVPNENEILRMRSHLPYAEPEDSIEIDGTAAIAVIKRNKPFSVDLLRITRGDLNAIINAPDIINLEICSINFKEIIADTLVFSLALTIPDTDCGYDIKCYRYNKKNRFEWDIITMDDAD